jgi:hypothetical protein
MSLSRHSDGHLPDESYLDRQHRLIDDEIEDDIEALAEAMRAHINRDAEKLNQTLDRANTMVAASVAELIAVIGNSTEHPAVQRAVSALNQAVAEFDVAHRDVGGRVAAIIANAARATLASH